MSRRTSSRSPGSSHLSKTDCLEACSAVSPDEEGAAVLEYEAECGGGGRKPCSCRLAGTKFLASASRACLRFFHASFVSSVSRAEDNCSSDSWSVVDAPGSRSESITIRCFSAEEEEEDEDREAPPAAAAAALLAAEDEGEEEDDDEASAEVK